MVYSVAAKSIYETTPDWEVVVTETRSLDETDFQNPDEIPPIAKIPGWTRMAQGYPVVSETAPNKFLWKHPSLVPPDVIGSDLPLVSQKYRDLVEQFEPDVHQFIPVDLYRPKSEEPFSRYYWFVICTPLDSIDPDHTTWTWTGDYAERRGIWSFDHDAVPKQKLVFNLKAIGDHHIWRDPYVGSKMVYCSDAFGEALQASDLTGVTIGYREQV